MGAGARGQASQYVYPDGTIVERSYHADGQLHQVKYDGKLIDTRTYDTVGRLSESTYGNGVVTDHTYFDDFKWERKKRPMWCQESDEPVVVSKSRPVKAGNSLEDENRDEDVQSHGSVSQASHARRW